MGLQPSGLFGGFYKKVGGSIGVRGSGGRNIVTALHHKSNKKRTDEQLTGQDKFTMLNGYFKYIKSLVNVGFKQYAKTKSAANMAYSYNYDHAFIEDEAGLRLNYPALMYSRGSILKPEAAAVVVEPEIGDPALTNNRTVTFTWAPQKQSTYCQYTDMATFLIYNVVKERVYMKINVVERYDQLYSVEVAKYNAGCELHCYMNFNSVDGKLTGDSMYVGMIQF